MNNVLTPLELIITAAAAWLNRQQGDVISFLVEQNRVLMELLDGDRPRLTNQQRGRLVVKLKAVGRCFLFNTPTYAHEKLHRPLRIHRTNHCAPM